MGMEQLVRVQTRLAVSHLHQTKLERCGHLIVIQEFLFGTNLLVAEMLSIVSFGEAPTDAVLIVHLITFTSLIFRFNSPHLTPT